ncbi:hypothetical protein PIB30_054243 [Stylosanthes scabra]|uniref:Uncharacterized protein n=1 Tax=Stylosanthes scabra TaxID=79078 RepID=A0ABU6YL59_9FABA|nr:hypothetical protein [Stylosanthes scabra]
MLNREISQQAEASARRVAALEATVQTQSQEVSDLRKAYADMYSLLTQMQSGGSSFTPLPDFPPPPPPPPPPQTDAPGTGSPDADDDPDYASIEDIPYQTLKPKVSRPQPTTLTASRCGCNNPITTIETNTYSTKIMYLNTEIKIEEEDDDDDHHHHHLRNKNNKKKKNEESSDRDDGENGGFEVKAGGDESDVGADDVAAGAGDGEGKGERKL